MLVKLLVLLFSYFLGAIPMAYLMGRYRFGLDVRKFGSGNVGATNAFRAMGPAAGITVLLLDVLKGFIAVILAAAVGGPWLVVTAGIVVIFGHTFSVFVNYRGGKGVATGAGTFLAIAPWAVLWAVLIFILALLLFRYVSVGSIMAAASIPIFLVLYQKPWSFVLYGLIAAAFVIYKHKTNINRLKKGTEPKITQRFR